MTVVTPGWSMTQRRANAAVGTASPAISATSRAAATPTSNGTPAKVSPTSKASPLRLKFRWSSAGNVVDSSYLPVSSPLARAPGPGRRHRRARGRQQLLQRLAPEDVEDDLERLHAGVLERAQALGDGLHRDAVGGDLLLGDQGVQRVVDPLVLVDGAGGGQCSWTRSRVSTPRLRRDRSIHARRFSGVYCAASNGSARRPALVATKGRSIRGASALRMRTSDRPSP